MYAGRIAKLDNPLQKYHFPLKGGTLLAVILGKHIKKAYVKTSKWWCLTGSLV